MDSIKEIKQPEIKLTLAEKRAVFDWSPERRQGVIDNSKTILADFLAKERLGGTSIDSTLATNVDRLWNNVVGCFQGNGNQTPLLVINNKLITPFEPNILPTHSEYHVSKVLTLSTRLFDKVLPESMQTEENALAVSLATIVHDMGALLKKGEVGPQEKMYKFHELRAIALVDKVVDALYHNDQEDHQQLKNKIKMLIASTVPKWNLDFSEAHKTTISKLLDPNYVSPITLDNVMSDLFLNPDASDDRETVTMKEQLHGQAGELFRTFDTLRKSGDEKAIREMHNLTHLMGAADHGAYMLEPSQMAEVFGLWQEQQTGWKDSNGKFMHRNFSPGSETAYTWATSTFTNTQWADYGISLNTLHDNPFVKGQTVDRSHIIADHIREILRNNKSPQDALLRVEGAFSPVHLDNLAHKLGLENNTDIKDAVITFSHKFAHRFAEPHSFDALSTDVLKLMYDRVPDKSTFLKEVLEAIIDDSIPELAKDGTLNIHIAPFAYNDNISSFTEQMSKAYADLPEDKRKHIKSIFFTLREGKDNLDSIKSLIPRFKISDKPLFGFALGGDPKEARIIPELMNTAGKDISTVVHFGLEGSYETMEDRLNGLFGYMDETFGENLLPYISIHIDDKYEYFNQYLTAHPEKGDLLKKLIKSVSPLGYLLTKGQEGFDNYQKFAENFKGAIPGSNNASMKGGYRIAVENLVQVLMNEGV